MPHINPKVIEDLYALDLAYLQDFYNRVNRTGSSPSPPPARSVGLRSSWSSAAWGGS